MQVPVDAKNGLGSDSSELRDRFSALTDGIVAGGDLLAPLELRAFVDSAVERLSKLSAGRRSLIIKHLTEISRSSLDAAVRIIREG